MNTLSSRADYIHQNYPRQKSKPWKENWYFNFIDRANNAWGINHISLQRHIQKGRFMAMHIIDGKTVPYINEIDLTDDFSDISDGNFHVEIAEPHQKFQLTFKGPEHSVNLTYDARFEVFDYEKQGKDDGFKDEETLALEHYEQAMHVSGTITMGGKSRPISCLGHRDHGQRPSEQGPLQAAKERPLERILSRFGLCRKDWGQVEWSVTGQI